MKNLLATLFLSRGVPMLLGGDEFWRTQRGNNNAYCQDNDISWFDWSLVGKNKPGFLALCQRLDRLQKAVIRCWPVERFYRPEEISWFNASGSLNRTGTASGSLAAASTRGRVARSVFAGQSHTIDRLGLRLSPTPPHGRRWVRVLDTSAPRP